MASAHSNDHSKGQSAGRCLFNYIAFNAPPLTYAHDVHEAIHAVADLEEQVLPLPLGRGAEWWPHQPRDAGDEEERAEDDGGDLYLLDHGQRDGLPLKGKIHKLVRPTASIHWLMSGSFYKTEMLAFQVSPEISVAQKKS